MRRKMILLLKIFVGLALLLGVAVVVTLRLPAFGASPAGERLERIRRSPNYRDGEFRNQIPTALMADHDSGGLVKNMWQFLFGDKQGIVPDAPLEMVRCDLHHLPADKDLYVWFGHSSYLLSLHGTTFLIDPTLCTAGPFAFVNRPFPGTDRYAPEDLPDRIDYLVITHDHYDHLDYETVRRLRDRIGRVICPLGVGAHFERWGFDPDRLIELDWHESAPQTDGTTVRCLPARHFSGRTLKRNRTLWASYLLETPHGTIYLGGDSGYGPHFREIGQRYPEIDLAILENGQYNRRWRHIHTMPDQLGRAATELGARKVITVHHSKYALSRHPWDEPLRNELAARDACGFDLIVAGLGAVTPLDLQPAGDSIRMAEM